VTVLMADGTGSYVPYGNVPVGYKPSSVVGADLDMDGRVDVATADTDDNAVLIMIGDGAGGLVQAASYPVGVLPSAVRAGDLNEDGVPDLMTSNQLSNTVGVLLSNP
jgi:VCBS repeat protein